MNMTTITPNGNGNELDLSFQNDGFLKHEKAKNEGTKQSVPKMSTLGSYLLGATNIFKKHSSKTAGTIA